MGPNSQEGGWTNCGKNGTISREILQETLDSSPSMPRSFKIYLQHRISTLSKREMFGDVTGKTDFTGSLSEWGFHCQKHRQFSGLITHQAGQARMIAGKVRHFLHMTPFPTHHFSEVGSEVGVILPRYHISAGFV